MHPVQFLFKKKELLSHLCQTTNNREEESTVMRQFTEDLPPREDSDDELLKDPKNVAVDASSSPEKHGEEIVQEECGEDDSN